VPRHLLANAGNNAWVGDELAAAFERVGLSVRLQGGYRNVVALPRGAGAGPVTFVAAHYDSVPDCPGADDNASGLAVMLECARVLAGTGAAPPVGFLAFNAEEDGLLGSRDFVAHGLSTLPCRVGVTHVLEMVGFRDGARTPRDLPLPWVPERLKVPDFIGLVANRRSNAVVDRALRLPVSPAPRVMALKTWGERHRLVPDLARSDHFPFWCSGHPAVLWTDTGEFRNPHYHHPSDTPDTLDYAFRRDVAGLLCSVVTAPPAR